TGEPMKYKNYWDFYNSEENKGTKVISFALGALAGSGFNIAQSMNEKADETYRLTDRIKYFTEIVKKHGTEEEVSYKQYYIRDTMANIVLDNKEELFDEFVSKLVENENINEEEELQQITDLFETFKDAKGKAERLNVKGKKAFLHALAIESYADSEIARY